MIYKSSLKAVLCPYCYQQKILNEEILNAPMFSMFKANCENCRKPFQIKIKPIITYEVDEL